MTATPEFYAVIPAAGQSTRMGRPKLTLPLAGRTVLEHVILTLREGGVQHVVVVTGPHAPELKPLAEGAGANGLAVASGTPDMRATIECGLHWLQDYKSPRAGDAFLVAPGDHPAFDASLVRRLRDAYVALPDKSIVVPAHAGKRGHPVLIGWQHVTGIRELAANCGVNAYLRENSGVIHEVETDDPGILFNLDSPQDFVDLAAQVQYLKLVDSTQ